MPGDRLQYLLEKFSAGTCTPEEMQELENWYNELSVTDQELVSESDDDIKVEMLNQFRKRVRVPRRRIMYRMVAAAAVLLIAFVTIFYFTRKEDTIVRNSPGDGSQDVLPGGNHATLTLADGSSILLDTAKHGGLAQQGISAIHKPVDGLLVYEPTETTPKEDAKGVNLIRTPRGGQYQVKLPDGTQVWLNASSSIQFPVSFASNARRVTITGEVYFEVSSNKIPFIVEMTGKGEVEVLGTHFNINAYDDEAAIKTTLLEGSVKVSAVNGESSILKPGQQAIFSAHSPLTTHHSPDLEEAIAWKNGLFKFNDADINTILRQAARWYDIDIEIRGNDNGERFRGKISRDVKLSEFLRILELNQVSFQLQGKKLIIQH